MSNEQLNRSTGEPTKTDRAMMSRAMQLAETAAEAGEPPVGAVVYETATGNVLAEGVNRRDRDRLPHGHAEFLAILDAARAVGDWRLNHCSLAVTLEPCPMCAGLIVNARIGRVIYGADDPKAGAVRTLFRLIDDQRLNHRAEVIAGIDAERSAELLRTFFRARRRNPEQASDAGAP